MLLSRYSDINFILNLPIEDGIDLIILGFEQRNEENLYQRWIQGYDQSITFDEFKGNLTKEKVDTTLTTEEILDDVEDILSQFRR